MQLESLCKQLYETADPRIRSEAEKALVNFPNTPNCLQKCQVLLDRADVSTSIYVINYAIYDHGSIQW